MLSICIPIYNQNCQELVQVLHRQCTESLVPFEIIAIDDASEKRYKLENKSLSELAFVKYIELPTNISRSAIRNMLGEKAQHTYLLFLDCDIKITTGDYIKKYIEATSNNESIVVGGRCYEKKNYDLKKQLHFHYGSNREVISAADRAKKPYEAFVTGNFIMRKDLFEKIKFSTDITDYGHEDTLFGIELKRLKIPIVHIDNPTMHIGLEENAVFIEKQFKAIKNLVHLIQIGNDMSSISIYNFFKKAKRLGIINVFTFFFGFFHKITFEALAKGKVNSLILFDMVRLFEFTKQMKNTKP